ncbi:hypothetical protein FEM48_Zijuj04G0088000 [Ziziphus jujuba var. spinosa]|uniref:Late embryogenesis abundant protein LEA-2 subgroup domain-containing protein n=1 Tax=Ziziphus jujuba var. spinosa TaxID=714518 RepID=A0A978VIX3_ZIZJJ|nr:uncharacterized protein LOC125422011 [Ziziphus jujuba var. spinosa]KAH7533042.1 hypothetical protein FEM48_Zijuj04G0088000 [Ziziphus jujuba var. spinosa]
MKTGKASRSRVLKLCCGLSTIFLIIIVVVLTTLSLTIFRPKQPAITAHPVGLENLHFSITEVNITIEMVITIDNPNYVSFKYKNSTAYVTYHETVVAEVPIVEQLVPAHANLSITTSADFMMSKLILNPYFFNDFASGCLNFNSTAILHGEASLLKIFKLHFKASSWCGILFFVNSKHVESNCKNKLKL